MIYRNLHTSLMRFCVDMAQQWTENTPTFLNFDASGDEHQLPKADVIGILGLSLDLDDHLFTGTVQLGYSTWDDTNLFRLVERVDTLLELLKPSNKLPIYDSTNSGDTLKGWVVVENGTRVLPVVRGVTRPIQFIAVRFASTSTFTL